MKTIYKMTIVLLLIFSFGHMMYTFLENSGSLEQQMWFFSASLAMLGSVFLNVLHLDATNRKLKLLTVLMNLMMFLFCLVLCFIVPEVQVMALTLVYLISLTVSVRSSAAQMP